MSCELSFSQAELFISARLLSTISCRISRIVIYNHFFPKVESTLYTVVVLICVFSLKLFTSSLTVLLTSSKAKIIAWHYLPGDKKCQKSPQVIWLKSRIWSLKPHARWKFKQYEFLTWATCVTAATPDFVIYELHWAGFDRVLNAIYSGKKFVLLNFPSGAFPCRCYGHFALCQQSFTVTSFRQGR